jgi:DnaJ like chaperone protein
MSNRLNSLRNEFGCAYVVVLAIFFIVIFFKVEKVDYVGLTLGLIIVYGVIFYSHRMKKKSKAKKRDYGFLFDRSEASNSYLRLVAEVVRIDGNQSENEKTYLRQIMSSFFSEKKVGYLVDIIETNLEGPSINVKEHCQSFLKEFDSHAMVQLMHLLVGICVKDAYLTKKENAILREIAAELRLPFSTYNQILLMYRFKFEGAKQRKKKTSYSSKSQLLSAYGILEINEDSSIEEIKKAYRGLAVIHHPDKVIHLGEEMQVAAKEKFQIISDAYELIKEKKGFA